MADHYDTVKGVAWREVLPWTTLTRAFSVAVSIPVLVLAAIGTGLTVSGWQLADSLLIPDSPAVALAGAISEEPGERGDASPEGEKFTRSESLETAVEDRQKVPGK